MIWCICHVSAFSYSVNSWNELSLEIHFYNTPYKCTPIRKYITHHFNRILLDEWFGKCNNCFESKTGMHNEHFFHLFQAKLRIKKKSRILRSPFQRLLVSLIVSMIWISLWHVCWSNAFFHPLEVWRWCNNIFWSWIFAH